MFVYARIMVHTISGPTHTFILSTLASNPVKFSMGTWLEQGSFFGSGDNGNVELQISYCTAWCGRERHG